MNYVGEEKQEGEQIAIDNLKELTLRWILYIQIEMLWRCLYLSEERNGLETQMREVSAHR